MKIITVIVLVLKSLLGMGVDQLYDGAGKAIALQVKLTDSPNTTDCDIGLLVINGLTTYENNKILVINMQ